ncbi:MAG: ATP-binding protein, partial [Streptomycetaceae bacterium]|nr:ATP-binding protein [Streptomycetaceae bacterium]
MTAPGDATGLRHLLARVVLVEERVRREVERRQADDPDPGDAFRGLYLSDDAVARLLATRRSPEPPAPDAAERLAAVEQEAPASSRLLRLARDFGLTPLDVEILLISLIPDLDERFEAFYGYLNDDVTRRRPSIGLALALCGVSPADAGARARLNAHAPLRAHRLVTVEDPERPFLTRALRVPDRVTSHLLGDDAPDPRLTGLLADWAGPGAVGDPAPLARAFASGVGLAYLREEQGGAGAALAVQSLTGAGYGALCLDLDALAR